jgi:hypothetical protein
MFPMPNSHDFMKNFNIQWIIKYFYLHNGSIPNWGFKKEKNSMTILKGFLFAKFNNIYTKQIEMRKIE